MDSCATGKGSSPISVAVSYARKFSRAFLALLALSSLVALSGIACEEVQERISPATPTSVSPTAAIPSEPTAKSSATSTTPGNTPMASGLVLPVAIAGAQADLPKYDRSTWRHWTDEDSDCQNARQEVLIAESKEDVTYETGDQCRVDSGLWEGPYTGKTVDDPGALDVDHMVPLANAHRSGAWTWEKERKREYANFLGYDNHLIATTSSANRSKGSKGPEEWRPALEDYWCVYAMDWVTIKNQWGLTVTELEYVALSEMLATCETTVLLQPGEGTPPAPPTPTVPPSLPTDLRYDPFGPDRDCGEFDTYEEAFAFYLAAGGPESDPHKLDVNSDGQPCESLPGGPSARESPASPADAAARFLGKALVPPDQEVECAATGPPQGSESNLPVDSGGGSTGTVCLSPSTPAPTILQSPTATVVPPTLVPTPPSPTSSPKQAPPTVPATPPRSPAPGVNCTSFSGWTDAQDFFLEHGGPDDDPYGLDGNRDGVACQSLPGAPSSVAGVSEPAVTPTPVPVATPQPTLVSPAFVDLPFDPTGPDRNCDDFSTWWDAQNFYLASGGPATDPHRLDNNGDGTACESLVGAPKDDPEPAAPDPEPLPNQAEFEDRDCSDFGSWQEAQDFFLAEGGPSDDPHRLDGDKDGEACESLPGAPKE